MFWNASAHDYYTRRLECSPFQQLGVDDIVADKFEYLCVGEMPMDRARIVISMRAKNGVGERVMADLFIISKIIIDDRWDRKVCASVKKIFISRDAGHEGMQMVYDCVFWAND